jgi:hypothetical protein
MQVENEELVFTLEVLVDKFGDEIAPFAVNLARNLTAAFWKYSGMADGEDGEEEDDQGELNSLLLATDPLNGALSNPIICCVAVAGSDSAAKQSSVCIWFAHGRDVVVAACCCFLWTAASRTEQRRAARVTHPLRRACGLLQIP